MGEIQSFDRVSEDVIQVCAKMSSDSCSRSYSIDRPRGEQEQDFLLNPRWSPRGARLPHSRLNTYGYRVGCPEPEGPTRRLRLWLPDFHGSPSCRPGAAPRRMKKPKVGPSRDRKGAVEATCRVYPSLTVGARFSAIFMGELKL